MIIPPLNNFSAGELSPLLDGRTDLQKYYSGALTLENFIVTPYGGLIRRPGSYYIAETKDSSKKCRLIPFEYNVEQAYIIEMGDQYMRFYRNGGQIVEPYGTEDLSGVGTPVAHWKCDDNAASTTVTDDTGSHDGTATANTSAFSTSDAEGTANEAFDIGGSIEIDVPDHNDFSFGDETNDSAFSILAWVNVVAGTSEQTIITKTWGGFEWSLRMNSSEQLFLELYDNGVSDYVAKKTDNALSEGWHFVAVTYDGRGGSSAEDGIKIYVDYVEVNSSSRPGAGTYTAMHNTNSEVHIGHKGGSSNWDGELDNISIWDKELTQSEIASLTGNNSTTPVEISTPFLEADLFDLHFVQSADVLYIVDSSGGYAPRKLSRFGHVSWKLEEVEFDWPPFKDVNTTDTTITPSATTGTGITLTASSSIFTSDHVGAYFKIAHPKTDNSQDDSVTAVGTKTAIRLKNTVRFRTVGAGTSGTSYKIQRKLDDDPDWHDFRVLEGGLNYDLSWNEPEKDGAQYRINCTAYATSGPDYVLSCQQYYDVGYVEITAFTSSTSVTADVIEDLGDTAATKLWAESSWSDDAGWPRTVEFFENRLLFAGNTDQPLTIWLSESANYEGMRKKTLAEEESLDDDALILSIDAGQRNMIRWVKGQEVLLAGTAGGAQKLITSSGNFTPTNLPEVKRQGTIGSSTIQPLIVNDTVIFIEPKKLKMREFKYDYDSNIYVAKDLTILAEHITSGGMVEMDYQNQPYSIIWVPRSDGQLLGMAYERLENIFSWFRIKSDGASGEIESVAIISGAGQSSANEDEMWWVVKRTIGGATKRYVEQVQPMDWGSDDTDVFFVDSGLTGTGSGLSSISGLDHLEGETVQILADGRVCDEQSVSSGSVNLEIDGTGITADKIHAGLEFDSILETMRLELPFQGQQSIRGLKKRIHEVVISFHNTLGGYYGRDASNLDELDHAVTGTSGSMTALKTEEDTVTFPGMYDIDGKIMVKQTYPLPMTVRAITPKFEVSEE